MEWVLLSENQGVKGLGSWVETLAESFPLSYSRGYLNFLVHSLLPFSKLPFFYNVISPVWFLLPPPSKDTCGDNRSIQKSVVIFFTPR